MEPNPTNPAEQGEGHLDGRGPIIGPDGGRGMEEVKEKDGEGMGQGGKLPTIPQPEPAAAGEQEGRRQGKNYGEMDG
jgi:hypothetical protein